MDHLTLHRSVQDDGVRAYELALHIGTSLDLVANCHAFCTALLDRCALDFAAVWMPCRYLTQGHQPHGYALAYVHPEDRVAQTHLSENHPLLHRFDDGPFHAVPAQHERDLLHETNLEQGAHYFISLGELGILHLYADVEDKGFVAEAYPGWQPLFARFAASLESCLAHQYLLDEIRERTAIESRLRTAVNRLSGLVGTLPAGLLVEDTTQHVTLVNPAFCEAFGLDEQPEQLIGLSRTAVSQRLRPLFAHPDAALSRLATLAQASEDAAQRTDIFTLADGRQILCDYVPLHLANNFEGHLWNVRAISSAPVPEPVSAPSGDGAAPVLDPVVQHPFHLHRLLDAVAEAGRAEAEDKGLTLHVHRSEMLPEIVVGDAKQLEQALQVLLGNAVRHTSAGHVVLTAAPIGRPAPHLRIQFAVADTGDGIAEHLLPSLFEQSNATDSLAFVKRFADAHGGEVSVQSIFGKGSVFTLLLPFASLPG